MRPVNLFLLGRWFIAIGIVSMVAMPLFAGLASASPVPSASGQLPVNSPNFGGIYVVDNGRVFVYLGYAGFANLWSGIGSNGSYAFTAQLFVLAFSLVNYALPLTVDVSQGGQPWNNQTVTLEPSTETGIPVNLVQSTSWTPTTIVMGGVSWSGYVATPVSLLPPYILNIGGLDLFAMAVLSEAIVAFSLLTFVASRLMRRALYAPRFSLLIWGHVFLFGVFLFVVADYQFIVQTFAGWSPFVYIAPLAVMWFFFALSLFNRTDKREVLQITARPNQKLAFRRFVLRLGRDHLGQTILIRESWGGFWARVWGHNVVLAQESSTERPETFIGEVVDQLSPTGTGWRKTKARMKKTSEFRVTNKNEDNVTGISFARPGATMVVRWPHLTTLKTKHVEARYNEETGVMVRPAYDKQVRTWPHYTEGSAEEIELENIHYSNAIAVTAEWLKSSDLSRMLGETQTALYVLRSEFNSKVNAEVESQLTAYWSLLGRTRTDLTDQEAEDESRKGRAKPTLAEELGESPLRRGKTT
jgi:hypothetical protein